MTAASPSEIPDAEGTRERLSWAAEPSTGSVMDESGRAAAQGGLPLIAFANRLPVRRTRNGWRLSDGGLVTALRPAMHRLPVLVRQPLRNDDDRELWSWAAAPEHEWQRGEQQDVNGTRHE